MLTREGFEMQKSLDPLRFKQNRYERPIRIGLRARVRSPCPLGG
jgi:hypothetical protein